MDMICQGNPVFPFRIPGTGYDYESPQGDVVSKRFKYVPLATHRKRLIDSHKKYFWMMLNWGGIYWRGEREVWEASSKWLECLGKTEGQRSGNV